MKERVLVVGNCKDCMFCIFDDDGKQERYGKYWCDALDKETEESGIPDWCWLDTVDQFIKTRKDFVMSKESDTIPNSHG